MKKKWIKQVQAFTDGIYPDWRTHFERTGRRVPPDIRKELIPEGLWRVQESCFVYGFVQWLGANPESRLIADMTTRLDAVLRFTRFVVREFVIGNYSLERNDSDVFDQFQLHYLALDGFIVISHDPDMTKRTSGSAQADRIMSFDAFLQKL